MKTLDEIEVEYCRRVSEGLLAFEIDPANFTKAMRSRNANRSAIGVIWATPDDTSGPAAIARHRP